MTLESSCEGVTATLKTASVLLTTQHSTWLNWMKGYLLMSTSCFSMPVRTNSADTMSIPLATAAWQTFLSSSQEITTVLSAAFLGMVASHCITKRTKLQQAGHMGTVIRGTQRGTVTRPVSSQCHTQVRSHGVYSRQLLCCKLIPGVWWGVSPIQIVMWVRHVIFTVLPALSLRPSSDTCMLKNSNCKTHVFCSFSLFGPHFWNNLSQDAGYYAALSSFRKETRHFSSWTELQSLSSILYSN